MQWSGRNEISLRNNLEDAEVAVKKPRLRVRQGKAGCNGRDVMRFHCVIILFETVSCLKPVARRGGFGNRGPPPPSRRDGFGDCRPPCGARRNTFDRNELRSSLSSPPRVLPRFVLAASGAAMKQKRTRSQFLPIICPSRFTFPCEARATGDMVHPIKKHRGLPCPDFSTSPPPPPHTHNTHTHTHFFTFSKRLDSSIEV